MDRLWGFWSLDKQSLSILAIKEKSRQKTSYSARAVAVHSVELLPLPTTEFSRIYGHFSCRPLYSVHRRPRTEHFDSETWIRKLPNPTFDCKINFSVSSPFTELWPKDSGSSADLTD